MNRIESKRTNPESGNVDQDDPVKPDHPLHDRDSAGKDREKIDNKDNKSGSREKETSRNNQTFQETGKKEKKSFTETGRNPGPADCAGSPPPGTSVSSGTRSFSVGKALLIIASVICLAAGILLLFLAWNNSFEHSLVQFAFPKLDNLVQPLQKRTYKQALEFMASKGYSNQAVAWMKLHYFMNSFWVSAWTLIAAGILLMTALLIRQKKQKQQKRRELELLIQEKDWNPDLCNDETWQTICHIMQTEIHEQKFLQAVQKERSLYLENVAHQMKSALSAASLQCQLLEMELAEAAFPSTPVEAQEENETSTAVTQIDDQLDRMNQLLSCFLYKSTGISSSRVLTGYHYDQIHLDTLMEEAVRQTEPYFQARNCPASLDLHPTILYADGFWLKEALETLLKNAAAHGMKGCPIHISLHNHETWCELEISNTAENTWSYDAFERYQTDLEHQHQNEHFGIGLAMAKTIIEDHFGTITLEQSAAENLVIARIRFQLFEEESIIFDT